MAVLSNCTTIYGMGLTKQPEASRTAYRFYGISRASSWLDFNGYLVVTSWGTTYVKPTS